MRRLTGKNSRDYGKVAEEFFKQFDAATVLSIDDRNERKKLQQKQKDTRSERRRQNKVTYKTGKNKVDLVRKK